MPINNVCVQNSETEIGNSNVYEQNCDSANTDKLTSEEELLWSIEEEALLQGMEDELDIYLRKQV
ncbi:hypothetical protein RUND412_011167, partial [Rhizina undulata]